MKGIIKGETFSVKNDIWNHNRRLERMLERINYLDITKRNKLLLLRFRKHCAIDEELTTVRQERLLINLFKIAEWLDKDFDKATIRDIKKVMNIIRSKNYSPYTVQTYKIILKKFYRWLGKEELISWIPYRLKEKYKLPSELLSIEDVNKLINACDNLGDKAFISFLYDSGTRLGEALTLRMKDISFDDYGALISVIGKTNQRTIRIVFSANLLKQWKDQHPLKNDKEAFVWNTKKGFPNVDKFNRHLIKKLGKKVLGKNVYPHIIRHSRATHLSNYLTHSQMCSFFGWSQLFSRMPSYYTHLSGSDVDRKIIEVNRIMSSMNFHTNFN